MLTKEQADEIKRLASEAAYEYLNNMIYSRTPDETNAERMNDYIDSLVGDDEPVAWRVDGRDQIEVYPLAMPAPLRLPEPMTDEEVAALIDETEYLPTDHAVRYLVETGVRRVKEANNER